MMVPPPDSAPRVHHSAAYHVLHAVTTWGPLVLSAGAVYITLHDRPHDLKCTQTLEVVPPVVGQPYGAVAVAQCQ